MDGCPVTGWYEGGIWPARVSIGGNASRGIHEPGVRQHPAVGTTGGPNPAPHSWAGAPGGWAMETFGPN